MKTEVKNTALFINKEVSFWLKFKLFLLLVSFKSEKKVDQELKTRIKEDRKTGKKALELELGTTIQDGLFHFEIWSEIVEKFAWEKRRPCAAFQKCKRGIHEVHGKSIFRVVICLFTFEFDLSTPRVQICFILFFEFFAFSENRCATLDLL